MFRKIVVMALLLSFSALLVEAQAAKAFSGRVFNSQNNQGIANLEVKLRPPRNSSAPIMIGTTDQGGAFHFAQVRVSTYLVEVSQGPYLLYRGEVDLSRQDTINIPVQHR